VIHKINYTESKELTVLTISIDKICYKIRGCTKKECLKIAQTRIMNDFEAVESSAIRKKLLFLGMQVENIIDFDTDND